MALQKHILFIKDMDCDNCVKRIEEALADTQVEFEVLPESQAVVVYGRNDLVYTAKTVLREAGFTVE